MRHGYWWRTSIIGPIESMSFRSAARHLKARAPKTYSPSGGKSITFNYTMAMACLRRLCDWGSTAQFESVFGYVQYVLESKSNFAERSACGIASDPRSRRYLLLGPAGRTEPRQPATIGRSSRPKSFWHRPAIPDAGRTLWPACHFCECEREQRIRYRAANNSGVPRRMHDKRPDPHDYPKQHRYPMSLPRRRHLTHDSAQTVLETPRYLAIGERLPNGLQIRLLGYEVRFEQRQRRAR